MVGAPASSCDMFVLEQRVRQTKQEHKARMHTSSISSIFLTVLAHNIDVSALKVCASGMVKYRSVELFRCDCARVEPNAGDWERVRVVDALKGRWRSKLDVDA